MAENTQSVLERTAADQWKVLPSGLTVLVRPMPGYSGTHVIYATRFGSIDRDFRLGEREVHLPAGVAHFLEHKMFEDEDGSYLVNLAGNYYGEIDFRMQYKQVKGDSFDWLYVDFDTLSAYAAQCGFRAECIQEGSHYDYLARLTVTNEAL
jgi:predicted Zn-dependent peptidase